MNLRHFLRSDVFIRWGAAILVLATGFFGTYALVQLEFHAQDSTNADVVQTFGSQFTERVNDSFRPAYFLTHSLESYIKSVNGKLNSAEFNNLLERLYSNGTNIRNIAVAPGNRITYLTPIKGNEAALGVYYPDLVDQWPAIQEVIREGQPSLTGPVDLVQGGRGLIYRYPIVLADNSYWGMVSTVLDFNTFVETQASGLKYNSVTFALRHASSGGEPGAVIYGDSNTFASSPAIFQIAALGTKWELGVIGPAINYQPIFIIVFVGSTLSLLLFFITFILFHSYQRRRDLRSQVAVLSAQLPGVQFEFRQKPQGIGSFRYISEGTQEMFGIGPNELIANPKLILQKIHQNDRKRISDIFLTTNNAPASRRETFRVEPVIGHSRWILAEAASELQTDGAVLWRGNLTDISEEFHIAEQLRVSASVFTAMHNAVLILDPDGIIIDANPSFTSLIGFEREEVIGKPKSEIRENLDEETLSAEILKYLEHHDYWRGEVVYRHKDGSLNSQSQTMTSVRDEQGQIIYYVCVISELNFLRDDFLTGLPNNVKLGADLQIRFESEQALGNSVALLLIGIDGFKNINDAYGHTTGDLLLRSVAQRLRNLVDRRDSVYRLRGDEFAIIDATGNNAERIAATCSRIIKVLSDPFEIESHIIYVTAGIGIATFPLDSQSPTELSQMASHALRAAKMRGVGQIQHFQTALQESITERISLIEDIRKALVANEFNVYFQPIIDLRNNSVAKAEALTRWTHPDRGSISPGVFIPLAEQSGLITPLGELITSQAIEFAVQVRQMVSDFQVSFNISPAELADTHAQHQKRITRIEEAGLPGSALIVEITEGLLLKADETVRSNIQIYRDAGLAFGIDDFGTGYSSLAYLQSLEVNWIKIDQSFVSRLDGQFDSLVLVKAMIVMAHELGLQVIAEGVETAKQRDLLRSIDCDFAQGFLYSPALPPDQFFQWLQEWTSESHSY